MPGFPERATRGDLGPEYRNNRPVENPETDFDAQKLNLLCDQVAGANQIVARASLVAKWNPGANDFDIFHQAEAWNPNQDQARPELTRIAAGRYAYLFASTYMNSANEVITTSLPAVRAHCFDTPASEVAPVFYKAYAWKDSGNPLRVLIAVQDNAGALTDKAFWLEVL
jgi:hypothetical protein